jgi:hypothetical protein
MEEVLTLVVQYISVPIGFVLILIGLYAPSKKLTILKYTVSSGALFIISGLILVLLAFPVAQFIASLFKVFKSK